MNILIISSFIEPVQSVASIRWTKLGKYLALAGHEVSVLTDEKLYGKERGAGPLFQIDHELEKDAIYFNNYYVVRNPLTLRALYWLWNERNHREKRKRVVSGTAEARPRANWKTANIKNNLIAKAAVGQYAALADSFDVVISTFDPLWPHEVAREFKKKNPRLLWVADFRDPVFGTTHFSDPESKKWASEVTETADIVSYIDETGAEVLGIDSSNKRVIAITNGYDAETVELDQAASNPNDAFTVVYTGTLYDLKLQNPLVVVDALDRLCRTGVAREGTVRFVYAGPDSDLLSTALRGSHSTEIVDRGLVERGEALRLQRSADVLALLTWNNRDERGIATGKLYEYLSAQRPVCAYVSGNVSNSVVKQILDKTGSGAAFEEASGQAKAVDEMYSYICELYEQWCRTGHTRLAGADPSDYTHEHIAEKLISEIHGSTEQMAIGPRA